MTINSHSDPCLTKSGGMSFDMWFYILVLEMKAHDDPVGKIDSDDWKEFYDDNHTPHSAVEEEFNNG